VPGGTNNLSIGTFNGGSFTSYLTILNNTGGGNVGIGTPVPISPLHVYGTATFAGVNANLNGLVPTTSLENTGDLYIGWNESSGGGEVDFFANRGGGTAGGYRFYDYSNAGAITPLMTIRGGGNVGIGTAAPAEPLEIYSSGAGVLLQLAGSSGTCNHTPGSSSETVSCSSDMRLKRGVIDTPSALPWLSSIRVRDFTWTSTDEKRTGVIAQELQKTHPEMVTYNRVTDEWTVEQPNPWTLVKILQEQQAEIDDLKTQLASKY
jgi:hypothetical protein